MIYILFVDIEIGYQRINEYFNNFLQKGMNAKIQQGFTEAWKLYNRYFETDPDDVKVWSDMVKEAGEISGRYADYPVIEAFLHVLTYDIDERSAGRRI